MNASLAVAVVAVLALAGTGLATGAEGQPAGEQRASRPLQPGLRTVSGTLERAADEFVVAGVTVDFGPPWYLARTRAEADHNGDGAVERLAAEVDGLVGSRVTVQVDADGGRDADVRVLNGRAYREVSGPPPWAAPPPWAPGPPPWAPGPPPWAGGSRR